MTGLIAGDSGARQAGLRRSGWRLAALGLGWLAGLALQLQQATLGSAALVLGSVATGALGLLLALAWPPARRLLPLMLAAAALAFGSTSWRAGLRLADRLDPALEGQDLLVTGVVASLPQTGPAGTRFQFDVASATLRGAPVRLPQRLALGWYAGFHDEAFLDDPRADLQAGQRWRLPLRLKRPHGGLNPDGYDVELQWFEQGVGATGYVRVVRGWHAATLLADAAAHPVHRLRQTIRDALLRTVADARAAGVLAALTVGDQAAIELDTKNKVENWLSL